MLEIKKRNLLDRELKQMWLNDKTEDVDLAVKKVELECQRQKVKALLRENTIEKRSKIRKRLITSDPTKKKFWSNGYLLSHSHVWFLQ